MFYTRKYLDYYAFLAYLLNNYKVHGDQYGHGNASHSTTSLSGDNWLWVVVGLVLFMVMLCLLGFWAYCCRKRVNPLNSSARIQSRRDIQVFTLKPPSYISADPPPYTAPDQTKLTTHAICIQNVQHQQSPLTSQEQSTSDTGVENCSSTYRTSQQEPSQPSLSDHTTNLETYTTTCDLHPVDNIPPPPYT